MTAYEDRDQHEEDDQRDSEPQRLLHDCGEDRVPELRILHFNDVYHPGYVSGHGVEGRYPQYNFD